MTIKKCIIVEDSEASILILREYIKNIPFFEIRCICSSYVEAFTHLASEEFDLLFLDMHLPGGSGLQLLNSPLSLPPTIVTTSSAEYAVNTYETGRVTDYLLKPYTFERLLMAINRALSIKVSANSLTEEKFFFIKAGRKIQRFDFSMIDYIEAYGIYSKIISDGQVVVVNEMISALGEKLEKQPTFMRVHKSFIVNLGKITSYDHHDLWIKTIKIPIGNAYRPKLENFMKLFSK